MAKTFSVQISALSDLQQVVDYLVPQLKMNTLVLLRGPMAAGKTTLVSTLIHHLSKNYIDSPMVSSPTFAIHQKYQMGQLDVHHFDLHRLETSEDIESTGFWDLLSEENSLFFIEWADRISENEWPLHLKRIDIDIQLDDIQIDEVPRRTFRIRI